MLYARVFTHARTHSCMNAHTHQTRCSKAVAWLSAISRPQIAVYTREIPVAGIQIDIMTLVHTNNKLASAAVISLACKPLEEASNSLVDIPCHVLSLGASSASKSTYLSCAYPCNGPVGPVMVLWDQS